MQRPVFIVTLAALIISALPVSGQEADTDAETDLSAPVEFKFPPDPDAKGLKSACADELVLAMAALKSNFEGDNASVADSLVYHSGARQINYLRVVGCATAGARLGGFLLDAYDLNGADAIMGHADPFWQRVAFPTAHALAEAGERARAIDLFTEILNPARSEFSLALSQNLGINLPNGLDLDDQFLALRQLGYLYLDNGDVHTARGLFTRAESIRDDIEEPNKLIDNSDMIQLELQNASFAGAVERLNQRREGLGKALGEDNFEYVDLTILLLEAYFLGGEAFAAEALIGETLEQWESTYGPADPRTLALLDKLAALLVYHGRYAEAEHVLRDVLRRFKTAGLPDSQEHAARLSVMGEAVNGLEKLEIAEDFFLRSLQTFDDLRIPSVLESYTPPEKQARRGLIQVLQETGREVEATEYLRDGLVEDYDEIIAGIRARVLAGQDIDEDWHLLILEATERDHGRLLPFHIEGVLWSGEWYRRQGNIDQAAELILDAVDAYGGLISSGAAPGSARERRYWSRLSEDLLRITLQICFDNDAVGASWGDQVRGAAFLAGQLSDSASTQAVTAAAARLAATDAGYADYVTRLEAAQQTQRMLETYLVSASASDNEGNERATALRVLGERRTQVATEIAEIRARISAEFPRFFDLISPQPVSLAELRDPTSGLLGANEALIVLTPPHRERSGAVIATTHETIAWVPISISEDEFAGEVNALRASLTIELGRNLVPEFAAEDAALRGFDFMSAKRIYDLLFGAPEIAALLADKPDWILAPRGLMLSLPFSTLVSTNEVDDEPAWLGIERSLAVVPALSSIRTMRLHGRTERTNTERIAFLGVGAPVFVGAPDRLRAPKPVESLLSGGVGLVEEVRNLSELPYTRYEILEIARHFSLSEDDMLLDERANERRIFELSESGHLDDVDVLLFATHALISGDFNGLTETALALTPPLGSARLFDLAAEPIDEIGVSMGAAVIEGARVDDGLLTMSEVSTLRLDADWVILSACNTAAGEGSSAEGLSGLARAFLFAGARSLLVSHWPVDDRMAAELTTRLVAGQTEAEGQSMTRAQALQTAMRDVLRDAEGNSLHPAYWAPFQIVGLDPL